MTTTSMVLFDANGCLKKYDSVEEILRDFYVVRLRFYEKRKNYLEGVLQAESRKLTNQARFICEKCDGVLIVENKKVVHSFRDLFLLHFYSRFCIIYFRLNQNNCVDIVALLLLKFVLFSSGESAD